MTTDDGSTHRSSSWNTSPATSQSVHSQVGIIQLDLPTEDLIGVGDVLGQSADNVTSGKKRGLFGKDARADLEDEGLLLQPDFAFDEDGNIIEFDTSNMSPRKRRKASPLSGALEGPAGEERQEDGVRLHATNFVICLWLTIHSSWTSTRRYRCRRETT